MSQPHIHSRDHHDHTHHAHGHASDAHTHTPHAHMHGQAHAPASTRLANDPAWSLLRLSAWGRVALAGGLLAALWATVIAVMTRG